MKLLYITNVYTPGDDAQSIQVMAMLQSFNQALAEDFLFVSPLTNKNKEIYKFSWTKLKINLKSPRFARQFVMLFKSVSIVSQFKPDYIYTRDILIALFFNFLGYKVCYEIHKPFETIIGNIIFRVVANKIKIVAISKALKDFVIKKYQLNPDKILIAHDGVFLSRYSALTDVQKQARRREIFKNSERIAVLYSGSIQLGKGIDVILKVASQCTKQNSPIDFYILGGIFLSAAPSHNLTFLGKKEPGDVAKYLQAADVLILPNTTELKYHLYTSPLKMFEYMASGTPILSSNIGSIAEVLDNNNSTSFPFEDSNELIKLILDVKNRPTLYQVKALRARQDVQKFDWSRRAQNIISFLK